MLGAGSAFDPSGRFLDPCYASASACDPLGGGMDIHKPKAAHSWREFLIEIGTIICGILIALGLEQAVEWSHWQKEIAETRETIRNELAGDLGVLEFVRLQDPCVDQRLRLLKAWADGKAKVETDNLSSMQNRVLMPSLHATAWEVAKSGAVVARMPISDRLLYGDLYDRLATESAILNGERDAWRQLARYSGKGSLGPNEARQLKEDLGMIDSGVEARRYNLPDLEQRIGALGIKAKLPHFPPGRGPRDLCQAPK